MANAAPYSGDGELARIAARYEAFATREAAGRSALYEELARGVAADRDVLQFLAALPPAKRQPNLLFAAVRFRHGIVAGWRDFRRVLLSDRADVERRMRWRRTQTNEPARCATLLPLLAALPQPLALLEVGAAAGLCLVPDHYGYEYGARRIAPTGRTDTPLRLACDASPGTPVPRDDVEVAWRAGIDLSPIRVDDPEDVAWLEALVWPDETGRLETLRAAVDVAREVRPRVVPGDLRHDVAALAAQAPSDATLVVFHSAVLVYVEDESERHAFARTVRGMPATWISNEAPRVFPEIAPPHSTVSGGFLAAVNGAPMAWTDPHGRWIRWCDAEPARPDPL